jgi:hypothetical protein
MGKENKLFYGRKFAATISFILSIVALFLMGIF